MYRTKYSIDRLSLIGAASLLLGSLAFTPPANAADTMQNIAEGEVLAAAGTATPVITASPAAGDTYTINNEGFIRFTPNAITSNRLAIGGSGAGAVVINNDGQIRGRLAFATASGPVTLNNNAGSVSLGPTTETGWYAGGVTTLGSAGDTINNGVNGYIVYSSSGSLDMAAGADVIDNDGRLVIASPLLMGLGDDNFSNSDSGLIVVNTANLTFDFGAGSDHLSNAGRIIVGRNAFASTLTLTGLETFENSGLILLGSNVGLDGSEGVATEGNPDDRVIMSSGTFAGSGASRIWFDVLLSNTPQPGCSTAPTVADCVNFTGATTAGSTLLTVNNTASPNFAGLNSGIALVVGATAEEHFILDPNSDGYVETARGPGVQSGLVQYQLSYDSAAKIHLLVGTLANEGFEASTIAASAQETWRATSGGWFDRQADLRASQGGLEPANGLWARVGASASDREVQSSYEQGGVTYDYDIGHSQRTAHVLVGADLLGGAAADSAWVLGGMVGYVRSDVDFDETSNEVIYAGVTGGVYASWVAGPLFVDASVNGNVLDATAEIPNMQLDEGVQLRSTVRSMGGRIDAGYKIDADGFFVEPLVGASYVRTKVDNIELPDDGGSLDFDDSSSLRAGAGVRLGMDSRLMGMAASFSLTGRHWSETEGQGETTILLTSGDTSTALVDDFSGSFNEVSGSVNLYSSDGGVSGFVNLGGKFADGYQSIDGAIGVRMRW